ncbi:class I SAM-dependent methyltransferase [Roseateles sp.]|uniref:class I SAM-dependent methyltransferase n=1 Tax=Roseateles sp. TaxID=1971397 RepID=UPI0026ADAB86
MSTDLPTDTQAVRQHYEAHITDVEALLQAIDKALDAQGAPATAQSLAALDQFHAGGLPMTEELARRAAPQPGDQVLDAGSGLGGPSRYLAAQWQAQVTGVDLSAAYVAVAQRLADRTGLASRVRYIEASITALPFPDAHFDLVWTQHVVMNVADRAALYREFRRVLKPGGRLAFFDPAAADGQPELHLPVPWASTAGSSHLLTLVQTREALAGAGFADLGIDDMTETVGTMLARQLTAGAPPAGPHLSMILGPAMAVTVRNFARNLQEGRVRLLMGVAEAR